MIKTIFAINMRLRLTHLEYINPSVAKTCRGTVCDATVPLDGLHFHSDGNYYCFFEQCRINWTDFHSYGVVDSQLDVKRQRNQTCNAVLNCNKVCTMKVPRELL
jgi:hypothetical protein